MYCQSTLMRPRTDSLHPLSPFTLLFPRLLLPLSPTRTTPTSRSVVSKRFPVSYPLVFLLPVNVYNTVADGTSLGLSFLVSTSCFATLACF